MQASPTSTSRPAPWFQIIRVRISGLRADGTDPKNKCAIDVETELGVFPVTVRAGGKAKLSLPLKIHSLAKAIGKQVSLLLSGLASQGLIGRDVGPSVYEIHPESAGARKRTEATIQAIRDSTPAALPSKWANTPTF